MPVNLALVLRAALEDYTLPWNGFHGLAHWARVLENGLFVARETGANVEVVRLFAVLHDCRRENEDADPDHGLRAAEFARTLQGDLFTLPDRDFHLLYEACADHTHARTHPNATIRTCWDADRLDLGRVGITPDPAYLCNDFAKHPATILWADERACMDVFPSLIRDDWRIDLAAKQFLAS